MFISLLYKHTLDVSGPKMVTVPGLLTPQGTKEDTVQNSSMFWKGLPHPHLMLQNGTYATQQPTGRRRWKGQNVS